MTGEKTRKECIAVTDETGHELMIFGLLVRHDLANFAQDVYKVCDPSARGRFIDRYTVNRVDETDQFWIKDECAPGHTVEKKLYSTVQRCPCPSEECLSNLTKPAQQA